MSKKQIAELSNFFVTGINYKKTDTEVRGSFAISPEQYNNILELAAGYEVRDLFVLSTCNRSEIYGIADHPEQLADLFVHRHRVRLNYLTTWPTVKMAWMPFSICLMSELDWIPRFWVIMKLWANSGRL